MKDATPNAAIRRTLGYPRVSTREQEIAGVSLDAQAEKIGNYCRLHSLPAPILFPEVESGGEENEANRKKVAALLADVRRGDMVIVTDIDRFGRDVVFIVKNVRQIMRKGAVFVAIDKGFDSRSPMAEDTLANWAVGAEQERRRIKERTEGGRKHLRAQGHFVEGHPPFGYERQPKPKGTKTPLPLRVVPEHAAVVRRMFALCLEGYSVFATAKRLRQEYGSIKAFGRAWVLTALRNRTYTGRVAKTSVRPSATRGVVQLPAEWIPAHEAIIDDETFNNAQLALRGRRRGRKPQDTSATANYLLRGFCRCAECGGSVAARPVDRSGRHKVGYYVCRGHVEQKEKGVRCKLSAWVRQPDADAAASEQFLTFARSLLTSLTRPPRQIEKPDFAAQRREIKMSRQRVVEFVATGLFTVDDVKTELNRLDDALAAIEAKEAEFKETAGNDTVETRKHARAYVQQIVDEWNVLPLDIQRSIIRSFSSKVEATKDKQIRTTWRDPSQISAAHGAQELPALRPAPNVAALSAPLPTASLSPSVAALPAPTMSARDYLGSPERAVAPVERRQS
ncbi:recombinase family protein [Sorangium atrum]|uniref:Recombinase family protein n=1 Tax=Sorangium atrum TaxID=2995308 RepID=A0ABT5C7D6_9BACT|nr:recombinase family protein [Sorangium aterium]MDC0681563.1 recombinase family protein [Sorangium aterium]